jgi:glycosyltransferase involved in cell wall biosynthesis
LRLLFLSNLYPPYEIGGYEQWCQEVAVSLRERGHNVWVLTSRYGLDGTPVDEQDIIRTLHLQADTRYYKPWDFFLTRGRQERANQEEMRKVLADKDPDLVVVWGMWNLGRALPYCVEQWMPKGVAYYISSYWPSDVDIHEEYWRLPARRPLAELLKKPARSLALAQMRREGYPPALQFQQAVCCSQYVRDTLVQANKVPPTTSVLFGGIDPEQFLRCAETRIEAGNGPLRLLYFGSILPQKGIYTAIEALALLKQRGLAHRVKLSILGAGHPSYEAYLRAQVAEWDIGAHVEFLGRVPRDEIPSWLGFFDVFLFTSHWPEPMARTVMEAMAARLLVIASEVGGQVEMLVHGENSLTYPAKDAQALALCLQQVLDDPLLVSKLAQAGQQTVLERFTLKRMVDDLEAWLGSLLE